ncbi:acetate/propionate family kinase [Leucobacter luti]|uniref:Acetate kinase n=1 Tax=Leucobacter luti TaxID=340320 RepID=A0A4Q7TZW8_9MICO|nr:acetate kinase [Leucobacter luti]MBL3699024.1 acetate kinase [Leucobacter luti]RZT66523.1 acetate kinase [Leucobacter luti]
MSNVLVVNAGSSSIKYQLIAAGTGARLASGLVERIGDPVGRIVHQGIERSERELAVPDHTAGFAAMVAEFERHGTPVDSLDIAALGHRVVQGGGEFIAPTLLDDYVTERINQLSELAPLHNPGHYQAIIAARALFATVPHVAVFDTAFHQSMPPSAYTYAIDTEVAAEYGIRRYGFHGVSHQVVSRRAAEFLGRPLESLRQVVLHLGNGASACAVDGGRSVDTSMGLTPLEGLVMGTRSGDIDPGAMLHLLRAGYSPEQLDELLNQRSGLLGVARTNDFRDVRAAADAGDPAARLAIDIAVHRIRHYLGAYLVTLGGGDAIVFTAGVGENNAALRAEVCAGLEWFGVQLDPERNEAPAGAARRISADSSRVEVLVVPTDEEAEIARQTWELVAA